MVVVGTKGKCSSDPVQQVGEPGGVFNDFVNQRAFFDTVTLSLWGEMEEHPQGIRDVKNLAIGGNPAFGQKRRLYSRSLHGICTFTGNPVELRYGRLAGYAALPQFRLILRSRNRPVLLGEVIYLLNSLFRPGVQFYVAQVELTFDLSRIDISESVRLLSTSARKVLPLEDSKARRTWYLGSRTSIWQARIYQKRTTTPAINRFELILRLPFLKAHGISAPHELLFLATLDLSRLLSFRSVSQTALRTALQNMPDGWLKTEFLEWSPRRRWQELAHALRRNGIDPEPLLRVCKLEERFRRMQQGLLW